jgi:hypothetical protein
MPHYKKFAKGDHDQQKFKAKPTANLTKKGWSDTKTQAEKLGIVPATKTGITAMIGNYEEAAKQKPNPWAKPLKELLEKSQKDSNNSEWTTYVGELIKLAV